MVLFYQFSNVPAVFYHEYDYACVESTPGWMHLQLMQGKQVTINSREIVSARVSLWMGTFDIQRPTINIQHPNVSFPYATAGRNGICTNANFVACTRMPSIVLYAFHEKRCGTTSLGSTRSPLRWASLPPVSSLKLPW